jgi:hypothetical protein
LTQLREGGPVEYLNVNKSLSPVALAVLFLVGTDSMSLRADYLMNADLSAGFACWHGDGEPTFLDPDGTEGAAGDKGAVPVIRMALSKNEARSVYQEIETKDEPKSVRVKVEVYASSDFKRSPFADDYSSDINWKSSGTFTGDQETPNADFWIHDMPSTIYQLSDLKPGQWVEVDCDFDAATPVDERTISFNVPPGVGTVYIRNASVTR